MSRLWLCSADVDPGRHTTDRYTHSRSTGSSSHLVVGFCALGSSAKPRHQSTSQTMTWKTPVEPRAQCRPESVPNCCPGPWYVHVAVYAYCGFDRDEIKHQQATRHMSRHGTQGHRTKPDDTHACRLYPAKIDQRFLPDKSSIISCV